MTPEENLLAAANYLSEHGHHKEAYFEGMGCAPLDVSSEGLAKGDREKYNGRPACAMGALYITAENYSVLMEAAEMLNRAIPDSGSFSVPGWNDMRSTSAEDVILTMKRATEL